MSSEVVFKELEEFLNSHDAGVFIVKGRWGVGKTHIVQKVVSQNRNSWGNRNLV